MNPNELRAKRQAKVAEAKSIAQKAIDEKRELTPEDREKFDAIMVEVTAIDESIKRVVQLIGVEQPAPEGEQSGRRVPSPEIGMTRSEAKRYSLLRAVRAAITGNWKDAGLEREASNAVEKQLGKSPRSFFIPYDVLNTPKHRQRRERRDLTITTEGADIKATDLDAASFIDLLRNKMILNEAGVTVLSGLVGDVQIPRQSGGASAFWLAEQDAVTESTPTTDKVTLAPKTVGAFLDMSRKFIQQASIDADAFAENDLTTTLALAMDLAGLHGSGAANQPTGIASTVGIGSVAGGANGAAPTWANIVALETEVSQDNADIGNLSYITNTKVRGKLKNTLVGTDQRMVWEQGAQPLNGYDARVTNQVSSTLTKGTSVGVCSAIFFGNWADLLMGLWGGLDILVDPYTASTKGDVRVVAFQDVDFQVRHPESFAAMLDALTT